MLEKEMRSYKLSNEMRDNIVKLCDIGLKHGGIGNLTAVTEILNALQGNGEPTQKEKNGNTKL